MRPVATCCRCIAILPVVYRNMAAVLLACLAVLVPAVAAGLEAIPNGPVKIINRATGAELHSGGVTQDEDRKHERLFRLDRAGDSYKIRCERSGEYLQLADWARRSGEAYAPPKKREFFLNTVPDSADPSMLWEIKPHGNGFWTITDRSSGKCLESRKEIPFQWQSLGRKGAMEQQWRFESVGVGETSGDGTKATSSERGFRLVSTTDLIYIPKDKGRAYHPRSIDIFRVFKNNKEPQRGFFEVEGRPLAPVWTSDNTAVLRITEDGRRGVYSFLLLDSGKVNVTVSVGSWSDHTALTVEEGPNVVGATTHQLIEKHGYPWKKYLANEKRPPRGFERLPENCFGVGRGRAEFWEYQEWPRCLLRISEDSVAGMATRPANTADERNTGRAK